MKTKYLLLFLFIFCTQNIFAQVNFLKICSDIPADFDFYANDLKPTSDSGYIVTGLNWQNNQLYYGPFLMKFNIYGDTVWTKHYNSLLGGSSVAQTCDGGYASIGGNGIIKTDSTGDTLWTKSYNYLPGAHGYVTADCGFILFAATNYLGAGLYDIYLIKTDSDGNPQWSKTYGADSTEGVYSLQQTSDGGYIIAGYSNSFSLGYRIYFIKTNTNGDTLWTKTYNLSGTNNVPFFSMRQTYDNGYIISGGNYSAAYLIKTDSIGNVIWSKTYVGGYGGGSVLQTQDSGYVFTCSTITGTISISMIKTNSNGNILWHNTFSIGDIFNYATPIFQTADGGYVFAGTGRVDNGAAGDYNNVFIKKTDANGLTCYEQFPAITANADSIAGSGTATIVTSPSATVITSPPLTVTNMIVTAFTACSTGIPEERSQNSSTIYPNLVSKNGNASIFIDEDLKDASITVFNVMGIAVYSDKVSGKGKTLLLTLNNKLSPGMYFIRIIQGEKIIAKKIIVQ